MPKTDPRKAFQMRREFWAGKADNANHVAELEAKLDSDSVKACLSRLHTSRNAPCD